VISRAYPSVHGCGDALSGALMNAGPVIHPPLMVMNAAPLQHFDRWTSTPKARSRRCVPSPTGSTRADRGARGARYDVLRLTTLAFDRPRW
jgi:hypothetical protein